ncbi:MAG: prepilin peptidase [Nitrospira sp. SB0677_bin_15]|nr:prepilin peptidase [Nitrospira sp. SB0667_bin_9]MYD30594.1 prepilin peptidase [Nitrospira sp. SB0661_bin_20]MYG39901.1 prepilin peptidase [Nitrospira sp. SB0677_bin_15]MYH02930.1 prepilin peptidase [Nitrospira sp. SB0675_bin_23]MYJ23270.1 prepilin peptidase [Nitrospira sp. SB0673_bin_12]
MDVSGSYILLFVVGLVIGSFLNVCILRIPYGESVIRPGSRCLQCKAPIFWFDNVPLLSFIRLGARCRWCRGKISWRYPLVECLNGVSYLGVVYKFGWTRSALVYALFLSLLLVVTMIDLDHFVIPDVITLPGLVIGFFTAAFILPVGWTDSLLGIALGGGILWMLAAVSPYLFGKEGLGGGDIKFLAMIGAFLGWQHVCMTLFLASCTGAVVGIGLMVFHAVERGQYLPFAPFLTAGAVASLFFYQELLGMYESVFVY